MRTKPERFTPAAGDGYGHGAVCQSDPLSGQSPHQIPFPGNHRGELEQFLTARRQALPASQSTVVWTGAAAGKAGEQIVNGSQKAAENIGNFVNNIGKVQKNKAIKDAKDKLPKEDAEKVEKMYKEPEDKSKEWIVSKEVLEENKAKAKKDKQQEKERQEQKDRQKSEQKTVPTGPENAGGR